MKKALAVALAICLLLATVGCSSYSATPSSSPSSPASPSPTPEPSPSPTPTEEPEETIGILGSHLTDVRLGLVNFGIPEGSFSHAPEEAKAYYRIRSSSSAENLDFDASIDYSMSADSNYQLISGTFGATWLVNQDNRIFTAGAQLYLRYVASIPYDSADPEAAQAWVDENMLLAAEGESVSTIIGDAKFELFGTMVGDNYGAFWMEITKVED